MNRNARPEQTNPYVPWSTDPTGALFSPLLLLAMVFGNKKKRGKYDQLMIVLVIGVLLFMCLSCVISDIITIWNAVNFAFSLVTPPASGGVAGGGNQPYTPPRIPEPPIIEPEPCPDEPPGPDDPIIPDGKLPYTYLNRDLLNDTAGIITHVSPEDVYDFYIEMWKAPREKWWWKAYGSDNDFSIWDFTSAMTLYEAGWQTRFAGIMAEAGVRFYYGGGHDDTAESKINWWAIFSQCTGSKLRGGVEGIPEEDPIMATEMSIFGESFQSPPPTWKVGYDYNSPYDWGNLSVETDQAIEAYGAQKDSLFILYGTDANWSDRTAFVVPSGCLWANGEYGRSNDCAKVNTMN